MAISHEDALKIAAYVLFMEGEGNSLRSTDIASKAIDQYRDGLSKMDIVFDSAIDASALAGLMGRAIANHMRATTAESRRVVLGTKSAGWRLGPKGPAHLGEHHLTFATPRTTQYTGALGEHAVVSELLACDWNAARLPIDDGVDIFAVRGRDTRTVQVKTAHASHGNVISFQFQINLKAHLTYLGVNHYYVFVLRKREPSRWINDFIILQSNEVENLRHKGLLQGGNGETLSLAITSAGRRYLVKGQEDITAKTNDFQGLFR